MNIFRNLLVLLPAALVIGCNNENRSEPSTQTDANASWKEESVNYSADTVSMNGFLVYNENDSTKRPGVVVVPEWWGVTDYTKMRARELAKLGYVAMVADIYGGGKQATDPQTAGQMATPFYQNPQMAKERLDAAIAKLKSVAVVDTSRMGAIGYCFGGGLLLNAARLGEDLDGIVSFHGSLVGTPAVKGNIKSDILVLHGAADPMVPQSEVDQFKKQMDSIGAKYTFIAYDSATHAFTNPEATETGKKFNIPVAYNAKADSASWNEMKSFFERVFNK